MYKLCCKTQQRNVKNFKKILFFDIVYYRQKFDRNLYSNCTLIILKSWLFNHSTIQLRNFTYLVKTQISIFSNCNITYIFLKINFVFFNTAKLNYQTVVCESIRNDGKISMPIKNYLAIYG